MKNLLLGIIAINLTFISINLTLRSIEPAYADKEETYEECRERASDPSNSNKERVSIAQKCNALFDEEYGQRIEEQRLSREQDEKIETIKDYTARDLKEFIMDTVEECKAYVRGSINLDVLTSGGSGYIVCPQTLN
tara:strand:+ start:138 stop:545 length:408 start_codon:yes stop_codon:yes gene_type:complete